MRPVPVRRTWQSTRRRSPAQIGGLRSEPGIRHRRSGDASEASCSSEFSGMHSGSGATSTLYKTRIGPRRAGADRFVGGDHQVLDQTVRLGLGSGHREHVAAMSQRRIRAPRSRSRGRQRTRARPADSAPAARAAARGAPQSLERGRAPRRHGQPARWVKAHVRANHRRVKAGGLRPERRSAHRSVVTGQGSAPGASEQASLDGAWETFCSMPARTRWWRAGEPLWSMAEPGGTCRLRRRCAPARERPARLRRTPICGTRRPRFPVVFADSMRSRRNRVVESREVPGRL